MCRYICYLKFGEVAFQNLICMCFFGYPTFTPPDNYHRKNTPIPRTFIPRTLTLRTCGFCAEKSKFSQKNWGTLYPRLKKLGITPNPHKIWSRRLAFAPPPPRKKLWQFLDTRARGTPTFFSGNTVILLNPYQDPDPTNKNNQKVGFFSNRRAKVREHKVKSAYYIGILLYVKK